jgi:DNA-binding transcriptional ArsR family regulator
MATMTAPRDQLSTTFAALADPTRRAILAQLVDREASVTELAEPFEMTLPAVSKHLKVLERAELIERSRHAQWRPCRLAPAPLKEVADWVEHYRALWEDRFDRLEAYLGELTRSGQDVEESPGDSASPAQPTERDERLPSDGGAEGMPE